VYNNIFKSPLAGLSPFAVIFHVVFCLSLLAREARIRRLLRVSQKQSDQFLIAGKIQGLSQARFPRICIYYMAEFTFFTKVILVAANFS
jgi:hypothetical protein